MKGFSLLLIAILIQFLQVAGTRVLICTKNAGDPPMHGDVAAAALAAVQLRGDEMGWEMDVVEDAGSSFNIDSLLRYSAVIFLVTDGDVLDQPDQRAALEAYVSGGGSIVGVHSAASTLASWPWFADLIGARHVSTPTGGSRGLVVPDRWHMASKVLPERWGIESDWMVFDRNVEGKVHVLVYADRKTEEAEQNLESVPAHHPVSWTKTHNKRGARVFFTSLGHNVTAWEDNLLVEHVVQGITWAAHGGHGLELLAKAKVGKQGTRRDARELLESSGGRLLTDDGSATVDEAWEKDILHEFADGEQPLHLAIAPDGRVFFTVRQGDLRVWKPSTNSVVLCGTLNVAYSNEDGMLGLALDPNFAQNNYLYLYWSPLSETNPTKNVLSRFTMNGDNMVASSELRIL